MGAVFDPACKLRSRNSAVITHMKKNRVYGIFNIEAANAYLSL